MAAPIVGAAIGAVGSLASANKQAKAAGAASAQATALGKKYAPPVYFKPYGLTTSAGTTAYDPDTGFTVGLSPQYAGIQQQALGGLGGVLPQLMQAGMAPSEFQYDPYATAQDIFSRESALLQPQFQQQQEAMRSGLFGSGRMGLMLAGESVGAGAGGMVNPDAFGLGRAQSQTLANLAASASERAQQAELQRYNVMTGMEQQRLANLSGLTQGLFGMGTQLTGLESQLMQLGLTAEQARSAAAANAGTIGAGLGSAAINAQLQGAQMQAQTMGGLFGGLGTAIGQWSPSSGAGNIGTAAGTLGTATGGASAGLSSFLR
jgi:hypothetical protein